MTKYELTLTNEPVGQSYRILLEHYFRVASTFGVVVRDYPELSPSGNLLQKAILSAGGTSSRGSDWPGTVLLEEEATIIQIPTSEEVFRIVVEASRRLFEWVQPGLPEDPFFLKKDGAILLGTIAHERDAYLAGTLEELNYLAARLPGLFAVPPQPASE